MALPSDEQKGSAAPSSTVWTHIARAEELRGPGPFALSVDGIDLVAVRAPSGLKVFEGRCPHQGALLGEGEQNGTELVCRNHRWRFDTTSGQRLEGPQCLRACPAQVREDGLFADVRALREAAGPHRATRLRAIAELPGPTGYPLVGNALELLSDQMHQVIEGWETTYGSIFRFRLGPRDVVAVSKPALVQQILRQRPENFRRMSSFATVFAEMGTPGVLSAEGAPWRSLRRLTMVALSNRNLKTFYPTLKDVAERLYRRWKQAADTGQEVALSEDLQRFAVDVTTQLAFGHDVNALGGGEDELQRKFDEIFAAFNRRLTAIVPYWRFLKLPVDRRLDRVLEELRTWVSGLVDGASARLAADPTRAEQPANFLEAMACARDEAGQPFPKQTILGNALQIVGGGEDTTAHTLAWAVHELCNRPQAVAALREELGTVLGEAIVPGDIDTAGKLAYANAIANEAMRLRPVVPVMFMETNTDLVLEDVVLPKGTATWALLRPVSRSASQFSEPETFQPERWLAQPGGGSSDPMGHFAFGSGPRMCPGRTLALLEMRVVLATLFQNFDVERAGPPDQVREVLSFTMHPKGLSVRLRHRGAPAAAPSA
ncbi:cytochrome P450 [Stigmatella erecta]|uniref:Cytochrome P450 n=1 Tax=Stigmatella erecta TaxID=83460 RepID=A0A1I0AT79_9BACT|nr:cytochrome P450 [Stigmatella erecta]SES97601.1 Cytochrome P450 [Stigmatella erecta]